MVVWIPKAALFVAALALFSTAVRCQENELFQCPEGKYLKNSLNNSYFFFLVRDYDPASISFDCDTTNIVKGNSNTSFYSRKIGHGNVFDRDLELWLTDIQRVLYCALIDCPE